MLEALATCHAAQVAGANLEEVLTGNLLAVAQRLRTCITSSLPSWFIPKSHFHLLSQYSGGLGGAGGGEARVFGGEFN